MQVGKTALAPLAPKLKHRYYYHLQTGTTRWSVPGEEGPEAEVAPAPAALTEGKKRSRWS